MGLDVSVRRASRHSEMSVNLLIGWRSNFRDFSERVLMNNANHLDFDSAIPKSPPLRPCQPKVSWMKPVPTQNSESQRNPGVSPGSEAVPAEWLAKQVDILQAWEDEKLSSGLL
jgi:hypothetical protein